MAEQEIKRAILAMDFDDWFVTDVVTKTSYTYRQFFCQVQSLAKKIEYLNSDIIIAILDNGYMLFALYFACMISNITIVPVDPLKGKDEIEDIIHNHEGAPVIVSYSDVSGRYDIHKLFSSSEKIDPNDINAEVILNKLDLQKVFMITYTSGSSGQAKGVKHSLKNLLANSITFGKKMNYNKENIVCHTMPMTYMAGILNTILLPFIMQSKIVLFPRFSVLTAINFWKNVENYNINTFWLSPTMLNILLTIDKQGSIKNYFISNPPLISVGTAPLFPDLKRRFEKKYSVRLYQSYGLSETLLLTTAPLESTVPDDSVGGLLDHANIKLGNDGEILIDVPWMFLGYSNENTSKYFKDNNYLSGDQGELKDGNLYITGRKKDLIIRGGINISPAQMEKLIVKIPEIKECCILGVLKNGEERTVCWYAADGNLNCVVEKEINTMLINELGINYKVDYFINIDMLPRNLNGKIDRILLKQNFHKHTGMEYANNDN